MNIQEHSHTGSNLQATFLGKVMFFFSLGLLVSSLGVYLGLMYVNQYLFETPMLMWALFGAELLLIFTSKSWSTKKPLNYWLFSAFTLITGITIAPLIASVIITMQSPALVIKALVISALMFTSAGLVGWTTKKSLDGMRGFLFISLIGMIIISVAGFFIPWGNTFEMVFSGFGVLLFSGFAMYDFQKIKSMPEDRYVDAAIHLYLDIFNLFIFVLRLLLALNRR